MPVFKVIIRAQSVGKHELVTVYKDKNTPKAAYDAGVELSTTMFPGVTTSIEIEEMPGLVLS